MLSYESKRILHIEYYIRYYDNKGKDLFTFRFIKAEGEDFGLIRVYVEIIITYSVSHEFILLPPDVSVFPLVHLRYTKNYFMTMTDVSWRFT